MKLMQLENPHFDWPFEASQHMIHLIVTGAFRRNVLRWGAFCVKRWQPRASSPMVAEITSSDSSQVPPQSSNPRFYSGFLMASRLVLSVWTYECISASPGRKKCAGSYNARKVNLSQSGGQLRSGWSYKALVCNALIHFSILRCLILQDRIWIRNPLQFLFRLPPYIFSFWLDAEFSHAQGTGLFEAWWWRTSPSSLQGPKWELW